MIAMDRMHSTSPFLLSRRGAVLSGLAVLGGCVAESAWPGPAVTVPLRRADGFLMPDGAVLPYRVWRPAGEVRAVALALHGFNDSRNAWEIPAPALTAAGILLYAPDQRGFGAAPGRGLWPGGDALVDDAATMARLLRAVHPEVPLALIGESMGGAVVMRLASEREPAADCYVLSAPAVWGWSRMNWAMQAGLVLVAGLVPGLTVARGPVPVRATDNLDALRRLSRDPLTIHETRFDTLRGLVDLMDDAQLAAPRFRAPGLFLYGAHDELVPAQATRAMWQRLPEGAVRAYYPDGYHLLPRDLGRDAVLRDVALWITDRVAPRAAMAAAAGFLANRREEG